MKFCARGTIWSEIWVDGGINRCFYDSFWAILLFAHILVFGVAQYFIFTRRAILVGRQQTRLNWCHILQVFCTILLMLEALLHMVLFDVYLTTKTLLGHQVLYACLVIAAYLVSLVLLSVEKKWTLPSSSDRGNGLILLLFWVLLLVRENLMFVSWKNPTWWWQLQSESDKTELGLFVVRYMLTLLLLIFGMTRRAIVPYSHLIDEESGPATLDDSSTWSNAWRKIRLLLPYVWPKGSLRLQGSVLVCFVLLVLGRVINVFVPIYSKYIVNSLTLDPDVKNPTLQFRWDIILIYVALVFLKGGNTGARGLLNNLRSLLWIKIQQFSTKAIQIKLFKHLHCLSLRWHLSKKTGEMLRVIDRGTNSINSLLSYILFQILPTVVDIIIAIVYFVTAFNYLFGLIVFFTMALYFAATICATEWRTKYKRERNKKENEANAKAVDSLLNFETVQYYAATDWEVGRYQSSIDEYQAAEWKFSAIFNALNLAQNIINTAGLASGSLLCAWAIVHGIGDLKLTIGDYVLFGTYLSQLYGPLNQLGNTYRMLQQAFIDMENMFDLLGHDQEVKDIPGASSIQIHGGQIEFKDVCFGYESGRQILKGVSFTVPPGQTYALVGHTGSGKSTIVRLLFRFYDLQSGTIKIDGQDISKVSQKSLREHIGVVPQDTVLFNNDIRYNIRYGRFEASDEDVEEVAKNAEIHDRILTFPKEYETLVGERGLRLSGGEKQRVAIARTLLKEPAVILLDEATAALDTKTERSIQTSLARVCENKTTIIVAHRLSTIINAHKILVLHEGELVESGTHDELLAANGRYADMWKQQLIKQEESMIEEEHGGKTVENNGLNPKKSKKIKSKYNIQRDNASNINV